MIFTRRRTLQIGISAFLTGLASRTHAGQLTGKKVIVIGAGIAGLAAAKDLQMRGAEVLVLEAGTYIGGRIRTDRSMGTPFEYGAAWIHGPSAQNPIQQLAEQVKAKTIVTEDDNLELFDQQGVAIAPADWDRLEQMEEWLEETLEEGINRGDGRSIRDVVTEMAPDMLEDPVGRWMLSAYTEFDLGAGIEDISARNAMADQRLVGADTVFTQGYDAILAPLRDGLDIRLNTPVSRISYGLDGADADRILADYVVCTVPLGVLKAGTITFEPALPAEVQNAIAEIGFGTVTKIAMKFKDRFWGAGTQYFGMMTEPKGRWNYWLNHHKISKQNILLGFSLGQYAPLADRMSTGEMTEDAMDVLRSVWGDAVMAPEAVLTTHWSTDEHFRGAYSYPQAGGSIAQYDSFEEPIGGRLFMAGEHTNFDHHSTTHGALMSGQRAASAISEM